MCEQTITILIVCMCEQTMTILVVCMCEQTMTTLVVCSTLTLDHFTFYFLFSLIKVAKRRRFGGYIGEMTNLLL